MKDIQTLPVEKYDLVINDFEPVSAWACHFKNKKCIGLSHQAAVLHPDAPKTEKNDLLGTMVLKYYAPVSHQFGFHFERYADNIYTPVIRPEIRAAEPTEKNHVTVYLPSYSDKRIFNILRQIKDVTWHVFSKHSRTEKSKDNVLLKPVSNQAFIESLITGEAVLCGAGFQTPSEALYLGKKLMVIPMKMQYEQQLNAVALARLGISVIDELTNQNIPILVDWLKNGKTIKMDYPDHTEAICDIVLSC